ncbi:hypothetical protein, partial [Paraburkholderia ribeironis]|uniref:hypothetical protein n=1 Tax=Paraburkholderia ribeironis TaxID=1247936 RepID=UPI001C3FD871
MPAPIQQKGAGQFLRSSAGLSDGSHFKHMLRSQQSSAMRHRLLQCNSPLFISAGTLKAGASANTFTLSKRREINHTMPLAFVDFRDESMHRRRISGPQGVFERSLPGAEFDDRGLVWTASVHDGIHLV